MDWGNVQTHPWRNPRLFSYTITNIYNQKSESVVQILPTACHYGISEGYLEKGEDKKVNILFLLPTPSWKIRREIESQ